jgi:hypothetical protein
MYVYKYNILLEIDPESVEFLATYVVVNTSILKVKEITSNACT